MDGSNYVYFARSIRGAKRLGHNDVLSNMVEVIRECGFIPAFEMSVESVPRRINQDRYIYERDIYQIQQSRILLGEFSEPSHGVGYEVAYALHVARIPVHGFYYVRTKPSAMLRGNPDVALYGYQLIEDLRLGVEALLKSLL